MAEYTKESLDRLDRRIADYEERLRDARLSMGGGAEDGNNTWHDNPAFEQAQEDVRQWTTELRALKKIRANAVVVESTGSTDAAYVGSTVTVQYDGDDDYERLHISGEHVVGRTESDVMEVSTVSPIGAAILGKKPGDHVTFSAPNGRKLGVKIITIE